MDFLAGNSTQFISGSGDHHAQSGVEVFLNSLAIVGVAELFDKTWFMGLLLAIRYNAKVVFFGSFAALFLHTVLAAAMGYAFARFLSPKLLHYMTAAVFFLFAILYTKDCIQADPDADAIEAGKEEAGEDMALGEKDDGNPDLDDDEEDLKNMEAWPGKAAVVLTTSASAGSSSNGYSSSSDDDDDNHHHSAKRNGKEARQVSETVSVFGKSFMAVFIAEWGDRTQIAMIGQHASQPLIPVFLGSCLAFFFLTLSAVGAATLLAGYKLRERVVFLVSAICFTIFGIIALHDALTSP
mmetsp:Transcript_23358/g.51322  ORF Transcript_23358/g.51322 Transcript_23358/m.51322 type:complete len:296 (-) Transcript_23358:87-974(-)